MACPLKVRHKFIDHVPISETNSIASIILKLPPLYLEWRTRKKIRTLVESVKWRSIVDMVAERPLLLWGGKTRTRGDGISKHAPKRRRDYQRGSSVVAPPNVFVATVVIVWDQPGGERRGRRWSADRGVGRREQLLPGGARRRPACAEAPPEARGGPRERHCRDGMHEQSDAKKLRSQTPPRYAS